MEITAGNSISSGKPVNFCGQEPFNFSKTPRVFSIIAPPTSIQGGKIQDIGDRTEDPRSRTILSILLLWQVPLGCLIN